MINISINVIRDPQLPFHLEIYEKNKNVFNYNSTKYKRMA